MHSIQCLVNKLSLLGTFVNIGHILGISRGRYEGGLVGKDAHGGVVGGRKKTRKRGIKTPLFLFANINSEAGQALDH